MANAGSASDPYSGRTQFNLYLYVSRHSVSGNSTRWSWTLSARNPTGTKLTYHLNNQPWSVNVEGFTWSGTHNLDFRGGQSSLTLASGLTGWVAHNSNGQNTVTFSASHGPAGIFGTAALSGSFAANRLPTVPNAPKLVGIDQETSTSFRYRFQNTGGGSASSWQAQYATNSSFTGATTVAATGTTTLSSLTPGATYWVRARGQNSFGYGAWGALGSVKLPLGAPTLASWSQNSSGNLVASWSAPSPSTGLTGYRLQVARNSGFTDGVQNFDLGNVTTRTVTGLVGGRIYYARVAARTSVGPGSWSSSRHVTLVLNAGNLDGWTRVGTKPSAISYFTTQGIRRGMLGGRSSLILESLSTGSVTLNADTFGIQRTITGLQVGKAYRFEVKATLMSAVQANQYRLRVVSEGSSTPTTVTTTTTDLGYVEFVADSSSAVVQILLAKTVTVSGAQDEVERIGFHNIKLLEMATDYPVRLRETVYESNLANHFDLACNSVGASWNVSKDGVTRFVMPGTALPVSAVFTDEPDADALHYVDIAASRDTRSMANRLDVTNYGVDETRTQEENDELVVTSEASIQQYGTRSARLETNLYDVAPYDESLSNRLTELLDAHDRPEFLMSQLRWNAQENLAMAQQLEVGQRVIVRRRGIEQDSQIVAITHHIQPERWMITIDLQT